MPNCRNVVSRRRTRRTRAWLIATLGAALALAACGSEESPPERDWNDTSAQSGAGGASTTVGTATGSSASSGQGGATGTTTSSGSGTGGSAPGQQTVCIDSGLTVGDLQLTEGDGEFDGNGPDVTTTVTAMATATTVTIEACVTMRETVSDFTTGSRCVQQTLDVANAGLLGDTSFEAKYTDTDHDSDNVLSEATSLDLADNLVKAVSCIGDTNGNDVCSATNGDCAMCLFSLGCFVIRTP
jgi:hypothetical protein